ncbi:MAG: response regulator transcription factor [Bacteroidota bacterium]
MGHSAMKLMIVDDSSAMRQMIRSVVACPSDTVTECEDGSNVVIAFQQSQPDVVLMDLQMPTVNGITATRNLKKEFPNAKIIIVSNFNDQEFRDEAREAGASSYFTKDDLIQLKTFIHQ